MRHTRVLTTLLTFGLAFAGCDEDTTGPAGPLPLAFAITVAGGPSEAFDRADRLAVRLVNDDVLALDTLLDFRPQSDDVRMRVRVPRDLDGQRVTVDVELRRGSDALFTGSASNVLIGQSEGPVEITLTPVVARIEPPATPPVIDVIGGTTRVQAAAVFATGDTIPGIPITWTTVDPNIITVAADGTVRAHSEGDGRVEARYANLVTVITVRVRATVSTVTVAPSTATIPVGGKQKFTMTARDANGNQLVRTAAWTATNTGIASVDTSGTATGLSTGTTTIRAVVDGVQGNSQLVVIPPTPAAPGNVVVQVTGQVVSLSWTDNATDETSYEVWRGPADSTQQARIASLRAGSTVYRDVAPIDTILTYTVRACNSLGCGVSPVVTAKTVPDAPANLDMIVRDSAKAEFTLIWEDRSQTEDRFVIEIGDSDFQFTEFDVVAANITQYEASIGFFEYVYFRVYACNDAGCSPTSNLLFVYFYRSSAAVPASTSRRGGSRE